MGRPVEYVKADNGSDPVVAVDKARELVEKDKIDVMVGPIFSPANAAVTDFLYKNGGIPSISVYGQPAVNLKTAHNLSFIPSGMFSFAGYYTGKYAAEELGWKTINAINYEDTASHELQAGFDKGFKEGGGTILSTQYVPYDTQDFSPYITKMKKADGTLFWIFSNGLGPFLKQYSDYGQTAPLITDMASNLNEPQMKDLGNLTGIYGIDFYTPMLSDADYPMNKSFIDAYHKLYPDENPNMDAFGGWLAVNLFLQGVKATGGDTTPDKLVEAMSTLSLDTPAGQYTMMPYQTAYVGKSDFFMMKTEDVGDGRIAWVPVYTYKQIEHTAAP
jgi:branched-chain amino acid transport system substrate-binding protein